MPNEAASQLHCSHRLSYPTNTEHCPSIRIDDMCVCVDGFSTITVHLELYLVPVSPFKLLTLPWNPSDIAVCRHSLSPLTPLALVAL